MNFSENPVNPPWFILDKSITGKYSPDTRWLNLLGYLVFIAILIIVVWILMLLVKQIGVEVNKYEQSLYNVRYDQIF